MYYNFLLFDINNYLFLLYPLHSTKTILTPRYRSINMLFVSIVTPAVYSTNFEKLTFSNLTDCFHFQFACIEIRLIYIQRRNW